MNAVAATALYIVLTVVSLSLFAVAASTLWWMLHAWRDPETLVDTGFSREPGEPQLSFSLLVPARHEEDLEGRVIQHRQHDARLCLLETGEVHAPARRPAREVHQARRKGEQGRAEAVEPEPGAAAAFAVRYRLGGPVGEHVHRVVAVQVGDSVSWGRHPFTPRWSRQ